MALTQSIQLDNNFGEKTNFDNVYIKVRSVNFSKEAAQANVDFYRSNTDDRLIIKQYDFNVNLDGKNAIEQAYEHLKTLPEFANATDC